MEENNLTVSKEKKLKICKLTIILLIAFAIALIGILIVWLLIKNNKTVSLVLSIIAGILIALIIVTYFIYRSNKKQAELIQQQIDNA